MTKRNRVVEIVGLVAIALLTIALTIVTFYFQREITNQRILFHELRVLRTSINLYRAINRSNPASLDALATSTFSFPNENVQRKYLDYRMKQERGSGRDLLDPFGHAYGYNAKKSWVWSTTKGYEFW